MTAPRALVVGRTIAEARQWVAEHPDLLAGFHTVHKGTAGAPDDVRGLDLDAVFVIRPASWTDQQRRRVAGAAIPCLVTRRGAWLEVTGS